MLSQDEPQSSPKPTRSPSPPPSPSALLETDSVQLTIHHQGQPLRLTFPSTSTLVDLSAHIHETLSIPPSHQKYLISPTVGLIKPPFPSTLLTAIVSKARKITLLGSTPAQISSLNNSILTSHARTRGIHPISGSQKPGPSRNQQRRQDDATYTFHTLRPLPHLPNPSRSLAMLERLRDDAGIRAAMRKHKWSVPLLTEMDPAAHTTHESRTLGLNRNRGEVIELRLRTDAGDGYRDYRGVRKTLCHELAHNVFGEHDANFWELCRTIEKEVQIGDWKDGGRRVGQEEYYEPDQDDGETIDHAGWTGGEFVLGGHATSAGGGVGLSRREILANAAEERRKQQRKLDEEQNSGFGNGNGSSTR